MTIEILEHTADIKYKIDGESLEILFQESAQAMMGTMIDLKQIHAVENKEIKLKAKEVDLLLHDFLERLLFIIQTEYYCFSEVKVKTVSKVGDEWVLEAEIKGEAIDKNILEIQIDVKAIAWEDFGITNCNGNWETRFILDI